MKEKGRFEVIVKNKIIQSDSATATEVKQQFRSGINCVMARSNCGMQESGVIKRVEISQYRPSQYPIHK